MTQSTCVIIGASHAGAHLAACLRQQKWDGRIIVIGDDDRLPYHRPPLSKALLAGKQSIDQLLIRPESFYQKQNIEFMLNRKVTRINRTDKTLQLADGETLAYDKLALCTGARVRRLDICGAELKGVHYLRHYRDVENIKTNLDGQRNIVIVGGGYIGLETAASLRQLGHKVTVIEAAYRVLQRVTAPEVSTFFQRVHQEQGIQLVLDKQVAEFVAAKDDPTRSDRVLCTDGSLYPADLIIVGIGVRPNVELAEQAGLKTANGIWVNEFAQTEDPDIVAAGDCTNHPNALLNTRLRLESVPNAMEQAKSAAASICEKPIPYAAHPWFWSDQFDIKLQIAGFNNGYDEVVLRGDPGVGRSFVAWYLKQNKLIAADCINRPKEFMITKQLLAKQLSPEKHLLSDESVDPKRFLEN